MAKFEKSQLAINLANALSKSTKQGELQELLKRNSLDSLVHIVNDFNEPIPCDKIIVLNELELAKLLLAIVNDTKCIAKEYAKLNQDYLELQSQYEQLQHKYNKTWQRQLMKMKQYMYKQLKKFLNI